MKMKKKLVMSIALGLGITYTVAPISTYAKGSYDSQLNSIKTEKNSALSEKAQVAAKEKAIKADIAKISQQVTDMTGQISQKQVEYNTTKSQIAKLKKEITATKKRMAIRKKYFKARAKSYYMNGKTSYLDVLMGSSSFGDLIQRAYAMKEISANDQKVINQQKADKEKLEASKAKVEKDLQDTANQLSDLQSMLTKIQSMQAQKQQAEDLLNKKSASLSDRLANLDKAAQSITEQKLADAARQAAAEKAAQAAKAAQATQTVPTTNHVSVAHHESTSSSSHSSSHHTASHQSSTSTNDASSNILMSSSTATGGISGIISFAKQYIGNSTYVFGGGRSSSDIANHVFDCSSFVDYVFRSNGVLLGGQAYGSTWTLDKVGENISSKSALRPGDLVFFNTEGYDTHVGIYIGGGQWIGCNTSYGVQIKSINDPYYWGGKFSHGQRVLN